MARVGIIVDDAYEDAELRVPYDRLRADGHDVQIIGVEAGKTVHGKRGDSITTQVGIADISSHELDALVIPGGYSPDRLRTNVRMVGLTRDMFDSGKPVAAICHAGWMLVEADIVDNRTVTSWPSIKTDLINAGARWIDRDVVEDANLITSRHPGDLGAFCAAIERQLSGGAPARMPPPLVPEATTHVPR